MSKGSKQRPTNKNKFDKNYQDIDWGSNLSDNNLSALQQLIQDTNDEAASKLPEEQISILLKEVKLAFHDENNN